MNRPVVSSGAGSSISGPRWSGISAVTSASNRTVSLSDAGPDPRKTMLHGSGLEPSPPQAKEWLRLKSTPY